MVQLFVGSDGVFGIALRTVALVVFAYVLFGKVFVSLGGGELLSSLAERVMGRYRGGPAKVAVISSAFFGMLSGSPVANVVGTGAFTIPLMKRVGYPADFAAGVEAVASTGGLLTPPVMGAAAFIMADFLGVGYSRVALAAVVPAALYYLALLAQVDLRAARLGLRGLDVPRAPLGELARRSWPYLVSFGVLLAGLFYLFARPEKAALYAAAALVACAAAVPAMRARLSKALVWMEELGREVLDVILVAAAAGLIVGSVAFTGLGVTLSRVLVELAEGNVWALLAATALASIVLGMGLPVTVCYILLAVLAAPALVSAGIEPMAAHMFLLYYGAVSFITPPVCTAAYAAASIAGTSMVRVGLQAIKLGIVAYVVPFAFVLHPEMLTFQTWWRVLADVPLVAAGALLLAAGLEGHLLGRLGPARRAALIVLGTVALVHPALWVKLVAACLGAVAGALERRAGRLGWALLATGKTATGDG